MEEQFDKKFVFESHSCGDLCDSSKIKLELDNLTLTNKEFDNYYKLSFNVTNHPIINDNSVKSDNLVAPDNLNLINQFYDYINIGDNLEIPNESYGFNLVLNDQRNEIDKIHSDIWKKVRWYINQYDFLVKDPIINRAFYKYWEIINVFNIFDDFNKEKDLIFHCAEAPGGFIQGSNIFLKLENDNNKYIKPVIDKVVDEEGFTIIHSQKSKRVKPIIYTISLNKNLPQYRSYNLPSYNETIMNKYVHITYGKDNTGDINNLKNIDYVKDLANKYNHTSQFYLITADGGFDEGTDFNNKEQLHYFLILNEIYTALSLQKAGGHFILKVFDVFTETSIHLLYLLNILYEEVYIYKPLTSRPTNSEKYVICKKFKNFDMNTFQYIKKKIYNLSENIKKRNTKYCTFKLFKYIPEEFIEIIKNMNMKLLHKQCLFLDKAILYCKDNSFIRNYENELSKSIETRKEVFKKWMIEFKLDGFL